MSLEQELLLPSHPHITLSHLHISPSPPHITGTSSHSTHDCDNSCTISLPTCSLADEGQLSIATEVLVDPPASASECDTVVLRRILKLKIIRIVSVDWHSRAVYPPTREREGGRERGGKGGRKGVSKKVGREELLVALYLKSPSLSWSSSPSQNSCLPSAMKISFHTYLPS